MNELVQSVKIKAEDELRERLHSHPAAKKVLKTIENLGISADQEELYKRLLRTGLRLTESSYEMLFRTVRNAFAKLGIQNECELFARRNPEEPERENATFFMRGDQITIVFEEGILSLFDQENELKALVGHELGHFIYKHTDMSDHLLENFLLSSPSVPEIEPRSLELYPIVNLLSQVRELNADRIGLLVSEDFNASLTTFIKLAAGPATRYGSYDVDSYLRQANDLINSDGYFTEYDCQETHPLVPLRAKALELFNYSDVYSSISGRTSPKYHDANFGAILPFLVPLGCLDVIPAEKALNDRDLFLVIAGHEVSTAGGKVMTE